MTPHRLSLMLYIAGMLTVAGFVVSIFLSQSQVANIQFRIKEGVQAVDLTLLDDADQHGVTHICLLTPGMDLSDSGLSAPQVDALVAVYPAESAKLQGLAWLTATEMLEVFVIPSELGVIELDPGASACWGFDQRPTLIKQGRTANDGTLYRVETSGSDA